MEMLTRNSRILVGNGREEIHPLFNPDILCDIFRHMDVETLKSVRQTCVFWKEEANSLLQKKSKISIYWHGCRPSVNKPTVATFMKYVESVTPKNVFFRNYVLFDWSFHSREEKMTQFWLKCGQHIRNLTLQNDYCGFNEQSYVQNVFFNWTPNMESFQISGMQFLNDPNYTPRYRKKTRRVHPVDEDESSSEEETDGNSASYDDALEPIEKCEIRENIQPNYNLHTFNLALSFEYQNFPLQWKELFMSYPNLKSLFVYPMYPNYSDVDNIEELLTELNEFQDENPDKLPNLKELDIFQYGEYKKDCSLDNDHFEQAIQLKFKLESLRIYFESVKGLSYDTVGHYIAKLSPTLKTLEIKSYEHALTVFPPVGKKITFPNLKDLSITLKVLSSNNVDFLESTPALEKLVIEYSANAIGPRLFCNTITIPPLDSLHHLHIKVDILTEDCIQKIGDWFPNLSYFGATLDDKLLWAVYKFLNNSVEELKILDGKGVTDAGITGMEVLDVPDTDNENSNMSEPKPSSSKKSRSQEPPVKRRKFTDTKNRTHVGTSIRQMKKLRRVSISADYKQPARLTDDSVHNGFVLLPELTYLYLNCCERITKEALGVLCSRPNFTILDTSDFYSGIKDNGLPVGQKTEIITVRDVPN